MLAKIAFAALVVVAAIGTAAIFVPRAFGTPPTGQLKVYPGNVFMFTDTERGCDYVILWTSTGISVTPRVGKPSCTGA